VAQPRFSVVIPAFNAERTIGSAINSALRQNTKDLEVVVVNDGSDDDTATVVTDLADPRVSLLSTDNQGPAAARNVGIVAARGEYVTFLDSDDLLLPHYLERVDAALTTVRRPGLFYTDAFVFDSRTGRVRQQSAMQGERPPQPPPAREQFLKELLTRNFIFVSATVPRAVLSEVGGYSAALFGSEDYDLWLRILIAGYEPVWLPGLNALYRVHGAQLSRNTVRMRQDTLGMFESIDVAALPSSAHREILSKRITALQQEVRVVQGDARIRHALRQVRHRLGAIRERVGLAQTWYEHAPPEVAAAFPDLTAV
jgi:glycosyltransferase involved in cell wall biosynthesis